jgi:hypothetical protein
VQDTDASVRFGSRCGPTETLPERLLVESNFRFPCYRDPQDGEPTLDAARQTLADREKADAAACAAAHALTRSSGAAALLGQLGRKAYRRGAGCGKG